MPENSSIIGFVRYSLKTDSWKKTNNVFDEKYFNYRFEIFKNITLKCFQKQSDMDFILFILHSENIPQKFKDNFNKLEQDNSFLRCVYLQDGDNAFHDFLSSTVKYTSSNKVSVNFRIDNDDCIPINFIYLLRNYCKPEFSGHAISIPNIYIVQRIKKDLFILHKRNIPGNSIGLAYVTDSKYYNTIIGFGDHGKITSNYPTILLPEHVQGGIQTINGENVANRISIYGKSLGNFTKSELKDCLINHFVIEPDCLKICKIKKSILFFLRIKKYLNFIKLFVK